MTVKALRCGEIDHANEADPLRLECLTCTRHGVFRFLGPNVAMLQSSLGVTHNAGQQKRLLQFLKILLNG